VAFTFGELLNLLFQLLNFLGYLTTCLVLGPSIFRHLYALKYFKVLKFKGMSIRHSLSRVELDIIRDFCFYKADHFYELSEDFVEIPYQTALNVEYRSVNSRHPTFKECEAIRKLRNKGLVQDIFDGAISNNRFDSLKDVTSDEKCQLMSVKITDKFKHYFLI
jgi:hypothetical protein